MSTIATKVDLKPIEYGVSDWEARILGTISILEAYYYSVSPKYLKGVKVVHLTILHYMNYH